MLILIYSILSILYFNVESLNLVQDYRSYTAFTFFGGLADLFIMSMIWFVLDEKATPDVFKQGRYSYAVLNVINEDAYLTSDVEIEEEEE